jgi:hypothetical protein
MTAIGTKRNCRGAQGIYCVIQVYGTDNRNDVRGILTANLARTFSLDGGATNIPVYVFREIEAH